MSATSPAARPAWGVGPATVSARGVTLEAWYPQLGLGRIPAKLTGPYGVPADLASLRTTDPARGTHLTVVHTQIDLDAAPATTPDAYLRLQLLSHRIVAPGRVNLDGIEEVLPVNVWTSVGSCELEDFEETRLRLRIAGKGVAPVVLGVDRFPRMTDFVVPTDVRIAAADRVRLGAHLAPGTVVRAEGFVDYNAGSVGPARIQGRLNYGVTVDAETEVGGSASIIGAPEGSQQTVTIGRRCLLGSNAGVGISLGDDCVVEAGLYVTAGTKVTIRTASHPHPRIVPARDLSGSDRLLFRRNSTTGVVEAFERDQHPAAV